MRNINLLPRKPLIDQIFPTLLTVTLTLYLGIALILFLVTLNKSTTMTENEKKIAYLNNEIQVLNQQRQIDPLTQNYNTFSSEINALKNSRHDWIPIIELVTVSLSPQSRILQMSVGSEANSESDSPVMSLVLNVKSLTEVANYIVLMQKSPLLKSVSIGNLTRLQFERNLLTGDDPLQPGEFEEFDETEQPNQFDSNDSDPLTEQEFIESLEEKTADSDNESDDLLNQLQWIISQKMAKQQLDVDVPDKDFLAPGNNDPSSYGNGVFTEEEISKAKETVEQFKNQEITESDSSQNSPVPEDNSIPNTDNSTPGPKENDGKIFYYEVNLSLTISAPTAEK